MAKNGVSSGETLDFIAPAGGAVAGVPVVINDLVLVPISGGPVGTKLVGFTRGEWRVAANGALTTGQKVNVKDGVLVAPATAGSVPFGKLTSDMVSNAATALLIP
jgi:predicted RecA/RadA family phage recombinase